MQLVYNSASVVITPQSQSSSTVVCTETINFQPSYSPKLSMIWVQEFDGEKYSLVAKWVENTYSASR
ncbi:MAG: hypothetical protein KME29_14020 [Calothrix sp. FI2-JRJ7]|jgi:hypothetical protein|nr:hypothetical protein [Calothrix sp. FI2-JRJ7]